MWNHKLILNSAGSLHRKKLKSLMLQNMQYKMGLKSRTWLFETLRPIGTGLRGEEFLEACYNAWSSNPQMEYECKGDEERLEITWQSNNMPVVLINWLVKCNYKPEYTAEEPYWEDVLKYNRTEFIPEEEFWNMCTDDFMELIN